MRDFRDAVFESLHGILRVDPQVIILTNDMGAMGLDAIRAEFPTRVVNAGIAEQNAMSMAGGLAHSGKRIFVYGIAPHVTMRCLEQIKIDICMPRAGVTILGVGAGLAYGTDGPTHHGTEDIAIMRALPGMTIFNPCDTVSAAEAVSLAHKLRSPAYIRMDKYLRPELYRVSSSIFDDGFTIHDLDEQGARQKATILASGITVWTAIQAQQTLKETGTLVRVIDLFKLKPINVGYLGSTLAETPVIISVEENSRIGALGSILAEVAVDTGYAGKIKRLSLGDRYLMGATDREQAAKRFHIDAGSIAEVVRSM